MARPRLQDVAARAEVSPATASLVLRGRPGPSEPTRAAVLEAANSLGYRPNRTASLLARRRSQLLGVVLDVTNPFHADLVHHLDGEAAAHRLEVVLATVGPHRDEREAIATLQDFRCEALVLLGSNEADEALDAVDAQCPLVVIGRNGRAGGVVTDDESTLELAVAHLAERGHRRIAYVDGPRGPIATARRRGYRAAMRRHGLGEHLAVVAGGDRETDGVRAGAALLEGPRPTAVVAFNDRCAFGIREAAQAAGLRVPDDLALVGIDDSPVARMETVSLTSVSQDPAAQARAALDIVVRRLDGDDPTETVRLAPQLIARRSSAR